MTTTITIGWWVIPTVLSLLALIWWNRQKTLRQLQCCGGLYHPHSRDVRLLRLGSLFRRDAGFVMTLEIAKILTLSTAHISFQTASLLDQDALECSRRADEYGYFINTYWADHSLTQDLKQVLDFARDNGCDYVNLDRDGPVVDELPVYDW